MDYLAENLPLTVFMTAESFENYLIIGLSWRKIQVSYIIREMLYNLILFPADFISDFRSNLLRIVIRVTDLCSATRSSGARYHLVATYSVYGSPGAASARANPRSHNFTIPLLDTNTFSGFTSRWIICKL